MEGIDARVVSEKIDEERDLMVIAAKDAVKLYTELIRFTKSTNKPTDVRRKSDDDLRIKWTPIDFDGKRSEFPAFWEAFSE